MTKILIVDDDPIYHKMIAHAIEPLGFEHATASNGREGLEKAREMKPDLVITDLMMPEMGGYDLARTLRREAQFAHIPILVLTSKTDLEDKLKSFEAGADDHLNKPFQSEELSARVQALLRRAEHARETVPSQRKELAKIIAVHSLRGGTGSTSLAINLSVGLARVWKTTPLLFDLSMVAGQVALMLNMALRRTWSDIAHTLVDEIDYSILDSIISKHESGLAFIAAPALPTEAEQLAPESLGKAIDILRHHYDYIITDLSHDFGGLTLQALDAADEILLLVTPEMASVRAANVAIDTYAKLGYPPEKIRLVLNATFPKQGLSRDKIETALSMQVTVVIPYTAELFIEAINYGQPFVLAHPNEPITSLFEDLAFFLSKEEQKNNKPADPSEIWLRVYKRYSDRRK
ncbi:MAG: response regulator [Chloroflexota bacterium]